MRVAAQTVVHFCDDHPDYKQLSNLRLFRDENKIMFVRVMYFTWEMGTKYPNHPLLDIFGLISHKRGMLSPINGASFDQGLYEAHIVL